ncbi:dihydrolipoyl dehydrogenase [Calditrichota bacterium]
MGSLHIETELAVIGSGPGGYVAALRAADLGKEVVIIEEREELGGVCLIEGCIPSKALINVVDLMHATDKAARMGLSFGERSVDLAKLREWTASVVDGLTGGVRGLLKKRGVEVIHGRASFDSNSILRLDGGSVVDFKECIIATGSSINTLPDSIDLPLWSSAEALKLPEIPKRLVVVGGGYIGLEMGMVYAGLGSEVTVVEFFPRLLMGADRDLVDVMVKYSENHFKALLTESKVQKIEKNGKGYIVNIMHNGKANKIETDQVLVAIGRKPNTGNIGLENTNIILDEHGLIQVTPEGRTAEQNIFAIGDVTPGPALAHKASREGKVVAEVLANHHSQFDNRAIPAVVFTDPEIAWAGLTEMEAEKEGMKVNVGKFPLRALGRAATMGRTDGLVKVISDPDTDLVLGVGMVGPHVSELIAEGTLAIEMGATLEDLMVTIHPHPTLSEALMEAAEVAAGSPVHINPKK